MIPFAVILGDTLCDGSSEVPLPERNQTIQTFFFDRAHEAFRVGVRIRCAIRRLDDTGGRRPATVRGPAHSTSPPGRRSARDTPCRRSPSWFATWRMNASSGAACGEPRRRSRSGAYISPTFRHFRRRSAEKWDTTRREPLPAQAVRLLRRTSRAAERPDNATRITLTLLSRVVAWRELLTIVRPDTLVTLASRPLSPLLARQVQAAWTAADSRRPPYVARGPAHTATGAAGERVLRTVHRHGRGATPRSGRNNTTPGRAGRELPNR